MALLFATGSEEYSVVSLDIRPARSLRAGVMEQRSAGFFGEVAEVYTKHTAPRGIGATFKICEISQRLARGHKAKAIVHFRFSIANCRLFSGGLAGELFQQALHAGRAKLA